MPTFRVQANELGPKIIADANEPEDYFLVAQHNFFGAPISEDKNRFEIFHFKCET